MGLARTVRKMARSAPKPTRLQFRRKTSMREFLLTGSSKNAFNIFSGDGATFLDAKEGGKDQEFGLQGGDSAAATQPDKSMFTNSAS